MSRRFKVFVVGDDNLIAQMWREEGHDIVYRMDQANIIQYIGGADINPDLYGERLLPGTVINPRSDARDYAAWENTYTSRHFSVGICRGGQFLNCINGGSMWQHVSNHSNNHKIYDLTGLAKGGELLVTSTHHQMMIPEPTGLGEILAYADGISTNHRSDSNREHDGIDPEVIWYDKTRSLCFQPHSEYNRGSTVHTKYFFDLINLLY